MKDLMSKLKTRYYFGELSWKGKTAVLLPIIALSLVVIFGGIRINYNLEQFLALVGLSGNAPQAVILVDEPIWFSNDKAPVARRIIDSPTGYAPFPVFFQGWQSEPRNEIVEYKWNFGDNSTGLVGFNSAHVFEQPGTYNITLTVKNRQGQTSQDVMMVTVLDRKDFVDAKGVVSKIYYVAPEGDDTYNGKCQVKSATSNCGPWKTAQRAFDKLQATTTESASLPETVPTKYNQYDSVLFKRGGSYSVSTVYPNKVEIDKLLFGAYDTGNKPVIQYDGTKTGGTIIRMGVGSGNVAFVDLNFKFKSTKAGVQLGGVLSGQGKNKNLLALRVIAEDLQSSFFGFGNPGTSNPTEQEAVTTGVFMIDNILKVNDEQYTQTAINSNSGTTGTFDATMLYGYMGNLALIGNTFDHSYNHLTYLTHLNKAVIVNNNFSRPAFGRDALRIDGGLINGKGTNNVYVADNNIMGWRDWPLGGGDNGGKVHNGNGAYNFQLINIGPNGNHDQAISHITFERNTLTNFLWGMKIADADNVIIRNNLFVSPLVADKDKRSSGVIVIGDRDWEWRPNQNITIAGNTFALTSLSHIAPYPTAIFYINPFNKNNNPSLATDSSAITEHQNITIANNLIYRPTNSSPIATAFAFKPSAVLVSQLHINGNLYNVLPATDDKMFSYYVWVNGKVSSTNYFDLKQWQDTYGFDLNSQATHSDISVSLFNSLPIFYSNEIGAPDLAGNLSQAESYKRMFKLKNSSSNPAIDTGVDVSAYLPFDFFGVGRPNGSLLEAGNYDVGFFELVKENKLPVADFTLSPATGTVPLLVNFDGSRSVDPDGSIRSYNWTFDDSSTGTGSTTSHTYQTAGSFQVKLEVDDGAGGKATAIKTVSIASVDTTKPITTAGPAGGTYDSAVTVSLSANEPAKIFACTGLGCQLIEIGLSPITFIIDVTKSLFYYAKDLAGNIETTQTQNYVIGGACTSNWSCDAWSTCSTSGVQTRICNDTSTNPCGSITAKTEIQSCGNSGGTGNGLAGSYYSGRQLSGTPLLRTDPNVNFNWGSGSAYSPLQTDDFSVRWEGAVNIPADGSYTFSITTDDGGRLWIDGNSVIDSWTTQRETKKSGTVNNLKAGLHALKMEYFDASAGAIARLAWSGGPTNMAESIIPSSNLFLSSTPVATSCTEKWSCGRWQRCNSGTATRTCTDVNACGTTAKEPSTTKNCR